MGSIRRSGFQNFQMKRILIVSQYYYPENAKISDLAAALVDRGYEVLALTGKPNYPSGRYYPGYEYKGIVEEEISGVKVTRVPLRRRKASGAVDLLLNYASFVRNACKYIRRHPIKADAAICFGTSPITQAFPALLNKKLTSTRVLLWYQDLWPESVAAAGGTIGKIVYRFLTPMVRKIYKGCDKIMPTSKAFAQSILKIGDFSDKIVYAPQWAEDVFLDKKAISPLELPSGFRIMFAGNVGVAQDIPNVIRAAELTKDEPMIKWLIVGDGRAREQAERLSREKGLLGSTVFFLGRHPLTEMPSYFAQADAMLVSLKKEDIFALTLPAKVQTYMASGKPILTMLDGVGNEVVLESGCGFIASSGDSALLAENVLKLYHLSKEDRAELGRKSQEYYSRHFEKSKIVDVFLKEVEG